MKKFGWISLMALSSMCFGLHGSPANAANVTITNGGWVSWGLITATAAYRNTTSIVSPALTFENIVASGCELEAAPGLPGLHVISEKPSQWGCRVELDADPVAPGIQGFPAGTTFELGMCAQIDADPECDYIWSSDPTKNSDGQEHLRTTILSADATQFGWEDLENLGDMDFDDLVAVIRVERDADGDGLWDDWETNGIDTNADGVIDFILTGANPMRKDLYLQLDYLDCNAGGDCAAGDLHSHRPKDAAVAAVVAAFANAPVANPDASTGITLHVDIGTAIPHQQYLALGCGYPNPEAFDALKVAYFGLLNPRRFTHRYGIFGHQEAPGKSGSGCGEMPGNDFVLGFGEWAQYCIFASNNGVIDSVPAGDDTLASWGAVLAGPNGICETVADPLDFPVTAAGSRPAYDEDGDGLVDSNVGSVSATAGVLMHEFGHTLGLNHGGPYDRDSNDNGLNNKPNYLSKMNYAFGTLGPDPDGAGPLTGTLDFSTAILPSCVGPGGNGTLDSVAGGDDVVGGNFIRSGPDKTCNSTALGDDVQIIPSGAAAALDENNLNEAVGIGFAGIDTLYNCPPAVGGTRTGSGTGAIDWDCDGNNTETGVAVDVNGDGLLGVLGGADDWSNLVYNFQSSGSFKDFDHTSTDILTNEPDIEEFLETPGTISIDILSSINLKSKGVVPVAICNGGPITNTVDIIDASSPDGFANASTNILVSTIRFGQGSGGASKHDIGDPQVLGEHLTQFGNTLTPLDSDNCPGAGPDLVVHIPVRDSGISGNDTEACLTATLANGSTVVACDAVNIVPPKRRR